ncbi:MAG: glutathione S-transferase [Hydrocarboniphaga sp.]|uniref:glutathione S-transferase family protein n=1 Tax=Hydrocarboniphaga sp. TaxID=2033016 RepID=UPI00263178BF|nr:glutathione S-transferase family protein [Hydrocarboniphaga sp.]MDB5970507.1 glutathione S-transferase [Hydrocarboniphaga sp.]
MFQLYIANKNYSSWSLRPWLLMRECGIAFDEQLVSFPQGSSWDTFRRFSPNGKVPCLVDGDTTVWDSLAITEYVAERYANVWPADAKARAWARCAAAEMHSGFIALRTRCPMNCGLRVKPNEIADDLQRDIARIDELWNEGLSRFGGPFLAGTRFTAADAFFGPVAFRIQTYGLPLGEAATAYATRLLALPSMQDWYAAGLAEPLRETEQEAEILATGTLLADYRHFARKS